MPSLQGRLAKLYEALQNVPPGEALNGGILTIYNTLLALAQRERPDDAILSKMSEVTGYTGAATLRVLVGQIIAAFDR